MLINELTGSKDYTAALKRRRLIAAGLLCVGLIGFVCYFLLVPGSELPDFIQGFYLGAASGITGGALALLVRAQYLLTHPEARRRAKIKETDEREVQITHTAFRAAGYVTFFASAAALFVVLPVSMEAFFALVAAMMLYCFVFVGVSLWLSHRL